MALDKAALLAKRSDSETREVELPGGKGSVVVRALTRREALSVNGAEMTEEQVEQVLLALALVDPVMTQEEVATWQEVCLAGEIAPVTEAILELSGMEAEAPNRAARRFRK